MAGHSTACQVCMKLVSDEGIQCESSCARWFHSACVNITKSEYTRLSKNPKEQWKCNRVDCKPASDNPIVALTESVNKLMIKIDSWSDKIEKINEVSVGIETIKTDIGHIKDQLAKLEPRVSVNETKIEHLSTAIESLKKAKAPNPEYIIGEINDRSQRAKNVIVHGIPESSRKEIKDKIADDKQVLKTILQSLNLSEICIVRAIRIGKVSTDKSRPLKVTLGDSADVVSFFKNFDSDLIKEALPDFDIGISRDRTLQERSHLQELRDSLAARENAGERGLTIKYQNGVPVIIKNSKN